MNEGKSQPWYQLYAAAIVELDRKQLIERVDATETAIHGRLQDRRATRPGIPGSASSSAP
jgi:hypothetical protein